MNRLFS